MEQRIKNFFLIFFSIIFAGCAAQPAQSVPSAESSSKPGLAVVNRVEILYPTDLLDQMRVAVYGQIADSCSRLEEPVVTRDNTLFDITLATTRQDGASCSAGAFPFGTVIPLTLEVGESGDFRVVVNGVETTFTLKAVDAAGLTPEVSPTSSGQVSAGGVVEPSSQPTPVPSAEPAPTVETSPTAVPGESPATVTTPVQPEKEETCTNTAGFFGDVTIPDGTSMKKGETFTKTWHIRNEGTCTWSQDYRLVFAGGDQLNGPPMVSMPVTAPREIAEVSVNLTAPATGGEFISKWEFQDPSGKRFGVNSGGIGVIWVKIGVSYYTQADGTTTSPQTSVVPAGTCGAEVNTAFEGEVLGLINSARSAQGLDPLTSNDKLAAAARVHSKDMACQDFVDHTGSNGSTWNQRIQAEGYNFVYATENIYVGNPSFGGTPSGAFNWWMNSKIHRDNILSSKVTEIGVGYVFWPSSTYGGYYTLNFGRPK